MNVSSGLTPGEGGGKNHDDPQPGDHVHDLIGLGDSQVKELISDAFWSQYERLFSSDAGGTNVPSAISVG